MLAVRSLPFLLCKVVFLAVVEEKVMEKSCSCGRTGVEPEKSANYVAVVGYVHAMLKTCGRDMMGYGFQLLELLTADYIAYAVIIAVIRKLFGRADRF